MSIVLIPQVRSVFIGIALALWPTIEPFQSLSKIHATWVPFVMLLFIGYGFSLLILRFVRADRIQALGGRVHGGDRMTSLAVVVTLAWVGLNFWTGTLGVPGVLVAALVCVGMISPPAPPTIPSPRPAPAPPTPELFTTSADEHEPSGPDDAEDADHYYRTFSWLFNEEPYLKTGRIHRFRLRLKIPRSIYDEYRNRSHDVASDEDYVRFANEELSDDVVNPLVARIRGIVEQNGFDALDEIHLVMAFTRSIPYASDDEEYGREYPRYPVETLVEKRGDCEDHAILCGVLLHRLGHLACLAMTRSHAYLGVEAPVPIKGVSVYDNSIGAELFCCEVTPTAESGSSTQCWLGSSPHSGPAPARFMRIG